MLEILKTVYDNSKKYIKGLQRSTEERKKRYLIGASSLTVIVILVIWVTFLKATLPQINPPEAGAPSPEPQQQEESFWETFGRGFKNIYDGLSQKFSESKKEISRSLEDLKNQINKTNEITVQNQATSSAGLNSTSSPLQTP